MQGSEKSPGVQLTWDAENAGLAHSRFVLSTDPHVLVYTFGLVSIGLLSKFSFMCFSLWSSIDDKNQLQNVLKVAAAKRTISCQPPYVSSKAGYISQRKIKDRREYLKIHQFEILSKPFQGSLSKQEGESQWTTQALPLLADVRTGSWLF